MTQSPSCEELVPTLLNPPGVNRHVGIQPSAEGSDRGFLRVGGLCRMAACPQQPPAQRRVTPGKQLPAPAGAHSRGEEIQLSRISLAVQCMLLCVWCVLL